MATVSAFPEVSTGADQAHIAWELDSAVETGRDYVTVASRGEDVGSAVQLAHALGAPRLVVLGIRIVNGRRALVGYGIDVESQTRSYAAVQVEPVPPPEATLRRFAALLAGDKSVSTEDLITEEPRPVERTRGMAGRRKIAIGVAASAVIAGGLAIGFDVSAHNAYDASKLEGDDARQRALFDESNRKYHLAQGFAIGGVACLAASAALWFTAPSTREEVTVTPMATGDAAGLVVSGRF